jgi:hypothetical protein
LRLEAPDVPPGTAKELPAGRHPRQVGEPLIASCMSPCGWEETTWKDHRSWFSESGCATNTYTDEKGRNDADGV